MSVLGDLRDELIALAAGRCEWPGCQLAGEQMAHLKHRGMGGNPLGDRNVIDNVAWLCWGHHMMLDGERIMRRPDKRELFGAYLRLKREAGL